MIEKLRYSIVSTKATETIANIRANSSFAVTSEKSPGRFLELSQPFLDFIHRILKKTKKLPLAVN